VFGTDGHSTAVVEALDAFFGTDKVSLTLDSRAPGVTDRTRTQPQCSRGGGV
jgi:hypothetical protein